MKAGRTIIFWAALMFIGVIVVFLAGSIVGDLFNLGVPQ
jgi:hypothetical protein